MHARGYSPSECPNARSQPTAVPVQIGLICAPAATPGNNYSPRRVGDLALCVYVKGLRSNCRRDVSVLAESWKIMHSCAYMRPGATPSIRHECASSPLRGCAPRCPRSARSARLIEMVTQASPPCRTAGRRAVIWLLAGISPVAVWSIGWAPVLYIYTSLPLGRMSASADIARTGSACDVAGRRGYWLWGSTDLRFRSGRSARCRMT